jgi:hypothetical protein
MGSFPGGGQVPESRRAPGEADEAGEMVGPPVEFQPESGALAPCEAVDEAERERDPREDI